MEIWSHRGRVDTDPVAPDNTPAALALVSARGLTGVEIDTWLTADQRFVLGHDRETPAGPVDTLARAAVPERPDLGQALGAAAITTVNVELKVPPEANPADAGTLGRTLGGWLADRQGGPRLVVSSFSRPAADGVLASAPGLLVALLCMVLPRREELAELATAGYWAVHPHGDALGIEGVEAVHAAGLAAVAWTVNDPRRAADLADAGLDAVITDMPLALRRRMEG